MRDALQRPERPMGVGSPVSPPAATEEAATRTRTTTVDPLERALWTARPDPRCASVARAPKRELWVIRARTQARKRRGPNRTCCDVPGVLPEAWSLLAELWCSLPDVTTSEAVGEHFHGHVIVRLGKANALDGCFSCSCQNIPGDVSHFSGETYTPSFPLLSSSNRSAIRPLMINPRMRPCRGRKGPEETLHALSIPWGTGVQQGKPMRDSVFPLPGSPEL
ncbi:hypothetical protein HPB50_024751 [Hyalomma asiaticum]|uniref:Uncharacterized protein n=1 Tax=Hyalomma asiaticum TaxID=266040 RepID=A0ACB7SIJ8_HYAAI|nr:hypothetical protein HPB50_024751 [Hyalomma asiaticum]